VICSCCAYGDPTGNICAVCEYAHKVTALFHSVNSRHAALHQETRDGFRLQVDELTPEQWAELSAALEKISHKHGS
jgi:hypothetical protein